MISHSKAVALLSIALLISIGIGCDSTTESAKPSSAGSNSAAPDAGARPPTVETNEDETMASGTGVEKEKPAAGKANVQGKALFNDQPAVGVEVKLCETFNQFMGGCSGKSFTTKTDAAGEYLIKDVPPATYEALTVRVFDTKYYVFATSGIISAAKYNIEADKTFFAPTTNLIKNDLKVTSPKMDAKIPASGIEIKWDAYPDAAHYVFSIYPDAENGTEANYDYVNKRVENSSFALETPLKPGKYSIKLEAFNANGTKLSQTNADVEFSVQP